MLYTLTHSKQGRPEIMKVTNITEEMTNSINLADHYLEILDAQVEFMNDPHSFGVRVNNIINDFRDRVQAEMEAKDTRPVIQTFYTELDKINAAGDFYLKQKKEM